MSQRSKFRTPRVVVGCLAVLLIALMSIPALAQNDSYPKWDLFAGWQGTTPGANVPTPFGDPNNPSPFNVPGMWKGFGSALTYNFDPHWGAEADFGQNWGSGNYETTGSIGPRFMLRSEGMNLFLHGLVSFNRFNVNGLNPNNGVGAILGGGMDLKVNKWLAVRFFEADYVWSHHNYSDFVAPQFPDLRRPNFEGGRVRSGLVFSWGGVAEVPPAASCSVQPAEVMVGEPITATVTASNFNPKHTVTYSWSGNGGQVTGKDTTAQIDTANAAPGSYTITAHVTDPKMKNNNVASCSANYTIKPLPPKNPPTMSCSASPATAPVGTAVTVTCTCTSPDGVPVSVSSWTGSGGTVSGSGSSATLNTTGVAPGMVTVGATCTDSRGLTGQASTEVTVETPPPPPVDKQLEARLALHSVYFPTNLPPAKNPNAGLVKSQEQTLTALASDFQKYLEARPNAHLTLEGHADQRGSAAFNQALSERRVARVKSFLVEHGVPEANIDTKAFGDQHNLTAAEVKDSVDNNPDLTKEERARILRRMQTIIWASNRRVDITLNTGSQTETSVRRFPFNAADSLTLIGGREVPKKKAAVKPAPRKSTKKP